ncbi:MAG: hypothetical protein V3R73_06340 [Sphingomonadales bacterium]
MKNTRWRRIISPAVAVAFVGPLLAGTSISPISDASASTPDQVTYFAPQGKGQQNKNKAKKPKKPKTNQGKALGKAHAPGQLVRQEARRLKDTPKELRPEAAKTLKERALEGTTVTGVKTKGAKVKPQTKVEKEVEEKEKAEKTLEKTGKEVKKPKEPLKEAVKEREQPKTTAKKDKTERKERK